MFLRSLKGFFSIEGWLESGSSEEACFRTTRSISDIDEAAGIGKAGSYSDGRSISRTESDQT